MVFRVAEEVAAAYERMAERADARASQFNQPPA